MDSAFHLMAGLWLMASQGSDPQASTACVANSGSQRALLVELYTSEGCSSCPPADRWLARLPVNDELIPLAFHVDYWDWIGWPDRFGQDTFSRRQRQMVAARGGRSVYTPQVFVDGRELVRWYDRSSLEPLREGAPALQLRAAADPAGRIDYQVGWQGPALQGSLLLAVVQSWASTEVPAGENAGRTLQHVQIVRALQQRPLSARDQGSLALPDALPRADAALVAWVEDTEGRPQQAVRLSLDCALAEGG